jgi:hypothetical protein
VTGRVSVLLEPATIRARSRNILAAVEAGASPHFRVDRSRLDATAARVEATTRRRYPDLDIPYHSRWRHFAAGGCDRAAELTRALAGRSVDACVRARIDLTVVSVLLDAGAGAAWSYREAETGTSFNRSEGLGVATLRVFMAGMFSAERNDPYRVDAAALAGFDEAKTARIFQADAANPLVGIAGRAALLRRLGQALSDQREIFGGAARPGGLYDSLVRGDARSLSATALFAALLTGLNSIWPGGAVVDGLALGDAWRHPQAGGQGPTAGWVPFHKLSQWLAYSLFEPFEWAGVEVAGRDALTALPEYRNGGLLLDAGVLELRDPAVARQPHAVGDELVVEWRALTVALIDEVAARVRERLGAAELPLACILEGGTWAAGRELAAAARGGDPPLTIRSDATVF